MSSRRPDKAEGRTKALQAGNSMYRSSEARDSRFSQAGVELSQAVYSELLLEDVSQLLPSAPRFVAGRGRGTLQPPGTALRTLRTEDPGQVSVT